MQPLRNIIYIKSLNAWSWTLTGKSCELANWMERYRWDIVGITAIRYASSGDLTTLEIISFVLLQKLFTKKKSGFLSTKICKVNFERFPISSRMIFLRLVAILENVIMIQKYTPTLIKKIKRLYFPPKNSYQHYEKRRVTWDITNDNRLTTRIWIRRKQSYIF